MQTKSYKLHTMKLLRPFLSTALSVLACVAFFASCSDNNNSYDPHQISFYPVLTDGKQVYADQQVDSVKVISTDNWTFTTDATWLTATNKNNETAPFTINVPVGYIVTEPIYFSIQPNTTGAMRSAVLTATSESDKIGAVNQLLTQAPYLNISTPICAKTNVDGTTKYTFTLDGISSDGSYHAKDDKGNDIKSIPFITFTIYSDNATLTSSAKWLTMYEKTENAEKTEQATNEITSFENGKQEQVYLSIAENTTGTQRSDTLTLTSNGVSTPITIIQN